MRFTLGGDTYDLTPALVRERLTGHSPEEIRQYWVDIDGVHWPVKQVIALAAGVARGRFQSQDARRWLRNVGFSGGSGSVAVTQPERRVDTGMPVPQRPLDGTEWEDVGVVDVHVTFSWLRAGSVTLDLETDLPQFPRLPRQPGLYRFDFGVDQAGVRTFYIGESSELARRANNYRNAKTDRTRQLTSRRIHKEIVGHLSVGGTIEFAVSTSIRWGEGLPLDLRRKSARCLAENAAVVTYQAQPMIRVLNIDIELGKESQ